ncbi:hypothetical protein NliqN6_0337 [Naganishia liquefaciens]|uniref:Uncharacterized protein n=1 Tax=Naganishia liquefaciens TaxID=104408 RepID=A0A8H3YC59_9TREE|nr:hypothetical protein NliqN6_0337 [Naganishia liquefaciens]
MAASSVPIPHMPTAFMHGSVNLGKPPSHEGRIEEGDGGGTVGPSEEELKARAKKDRNRAIRTVPPFAAFDPPSPILSPRLRPAEAPQTNITSPSAHAASPSLSLTLSNFGGDYEDDMQQPQASWWTFAKPGRWKQVQSLHNAWHEQMLANEKLRKESEHLGKDYFASKRESIVGQPDVEMQEDDHEEAMMSSRPPFGTMISNSQSHRGSYFHLPGKLRRRSASNDDIRNTKQDDSSRRSSVHGMSAVGEMLHGITSMSAAATPSRGDTPGGPAKTRLGRFKAMSTPASRRQSTDGTHGRPAVSGHVQVHDPPFSSISGSQELSMTTLQKHSNLPQIDAFSLGPPITGIQDAAAPSPFTSNTNEPSGRHATGSAVLTTTPLSNLVESPQMLQLELPSASENAATVQPVSPRRAHPKLSITMPPPVFTSPSEHNSAVTQAVSTTRYAPNTTTMDMPPPMFQQRMYQAQAPPTPHGWESSWRENDHALHGRKHERLNPRGPLERFPQHAHRHRGMIVDDPWLQPFEETAFESDDCGRISPDEESPTHSGEREGRGSRQRHAGAGGSDSSGPLSGISEKAGRRLAGGKSDQGRRARYNKKGKAGATERALTKWAALRRSYVKNGPGTRRTRLLEFLMFDARSTIYLRMLTLVGVVGALGLGCKLFQLEEQSDLDGILGSAPILSISYGSVSVIHCLLVMFREAFGKPIGLWEVRSKMLWVCLDLFFIALWSSDLSLTISDYMSTPLQCSSVNPWWTSNDYTISLPSVITRSSQKDDMCNRQAALIAFVIFSLIMYVFGMVISLFKIFVRLSHVAKSYEQNRAQLA